MYRVEHYLRRCVDSVRNQSYRNLEIILIDDGSPDRCGEICDEYSRRDSRVRVIHKINEGQAAARNRGLDIARGDYVGFVDGDDYVDGGMYRKLFEQLVLNDAQIACCGTNLIDDSDQNVVVSNFNDSIGDSLVYSQKQALKEHLDNIRITSSLCDKLFNAKVFDRIRMIEGMIFEDLEVLPRCLALAQTIVYLAEPLYHYVMRIGSTLREGFTNRQFDAMRAGKLRVEFYQREFPELADLAQGSYVEICLDLIYRAYQISESENQRIDAINEVRQIVAEIGIRGLKTKTLMKVLLLDAGLPFYVKVLKSYYKYAGIVRDHRRKGFASIGRIN